MKVIGLTGTIGSGKSTVSNYLRQRGYRIVDADQIAKRVTQKNQRGYRRVVASFSERVLDENQEIDRKKLSDIIFQDTAKRELLNDILHPIILEEIRLEIQHYRDLGERQIFLDAPLLIECGLQALTDKIIVVRANNEILIQRISKRDLISAEKAQSIIKAQMSTQEKEKAADYIVDNSGDMEHLIFAVNAVMEEIERFWKE